MASAHRHPQHDLEPHLWVLTLALLSGYAMGGYAQKEGLDGTVPDPALPAFFFLVPGILLAAFNLLAKNRPDRHMQALCIGFGINFVWTVLAKGVYELDGQNALWRLFFSFAAGALVSTLMSRASKVLVWPAAIWFGFASCLASPWDMGISIWLGMLGSVVSLIVTWMTRDRGGPRRAPGFGWTVLRAPDRPSFAESFIVGDREAQVERAIEAFEAEVVARDTGEFAERSVLYFDSAQLVPSFHALSRGQEMGRAGVRSTAYRVRRGFDEWWFLLHVKGVRESLTIQLDCRHRSRNFLMPVMVVVALLLTIFAWQSGSQALLSGGITLLAIFGVLSQLGFLDTQQSKERGESRRQDRMTEYYPIILRAAMAAIEAAQAKAPHWEEASVSEPRSSSPTSGWTRD